MDGRASKGVVDRRLRALSLFCEMNAGDGSISDCLPAYRLPADVTVTDRIHGVRAVRL